MTKGLDLIKRQQPEIIDGFPTGNIYIGVTKEELTELEDKLKDYDYWVNLVKCYGDIKAEDLRRFIHNGWAWEQSGYKKDKALEIIKEKKVNLEYLKCCENYEQYKTICSYWDEISEQEFDLLKEVLL